MNEGLPITRRSAPRYAVDLDHTMWDLLPGFPLLAALHCHVMSHFVRTDARTGVLSQDKQPVHLDRIYYSY